MATNYVFLNKRLCFGRVTATGVIEFQSNRRKSGKMTTVSSLMGLYHSREGRRVWKEQVRTCLICVESADSLCCAHQLLCRLCPLRLKSVIAANTDERERLRTHTGPECGFMCLRHEAEMMIIEPRKVRNQFLQCFNRKQKAGFYSWGLVTFPFHFLLKALFPRSQELAGTSTAVNDNSAARATVCSNTSCQSQSVHQRWAQVFSTKRTVKAN